MKKEAKTFDRLQSEIALAPIADIAALEPRWRTLEAVANPGPFRAWSFVAAVAAQCEAPWLLNVRKNGRDEALALLNRGRGRLHLHETGNPVWDAVFIEHNGLMIRPGAEGILAPALRALSSEAPVVLSGTDDLHLRAACETGIVTGHHSRFAPAIDLVGLQGAFVDSLSANARAQIRRALRLAGADLAIQRAPDLPAARAYFDEMVELHQASWVARGKAGAFAGTAMRAFHSALIEAAHPRGEADLLRISSAGRALGVLYTLRQGGHVCLYQSGFVRLDDPRQKPGLVCHVQAIEFYRSEGAALYDLLAGADRYKTTLAGTGGRMLNWFTLHPAHSVGARARCLAERAVTRLRS